MDTTRICSSCKKPLSQNAPQGLCPECLLKAALGSGVDVGPETHSAGGDVRLVAPPLEEIARLFPQLEILGLIGQGGMGAVYRARQRELDRVVALKILPLDIGRDAAFSERFTREARALAKLNHPGIVTLYEFGRADGLFFFLMEFVEGVNLGQLLAGGHLSSREALGIVPQICDALQYAHDQGVVHRDIKPQNILVDRKGRVKVADFGLAKLVGSGGEPAPSADAATAPSLTQAGKVMGTPQYMAPEQRERPTEVDHRADIYSLGVVFYQMLTGELPGKPVEAPSHKVHVDVRLDEVVLRALERQPERRYQQASQVKTDVETIARMACPPSRGPWYIPKWAMFLAIGLLGAFAIQWGGRLLQRTPGSHTRSLGPGDGSGGGRVAAATPDPVLILRDNMGLDLDRQSLVDLSRDSRPSPAQLQGVDVAWDNDTGGVLMSNPRGKARLLPLPDAHDLEQAAQFARHRRKLVEGSEDRGGAAMECRVFAVLTDQASLAVLEIQEFAPTQATIRWRMLEVSASAASGPDSAAPKAAQRVSRKFLRLVADGTALTFEGQPTSWGEVGGWLAKVPDPKHTVLEFAVTSDQITVAQQNEWFQKATALARQHGFEYASFIGVHPRESEGEFRPQVSQAARGEYRVAPTNGPAFEVLALCSTPRAGLAWWKPDGTLLAEAPGDRIEQPSKLCPSGRSAVEFAVLSSVSNSDIVEPAQLGFEPRPQYVATVELFKSGVVAGEATLVGFRSTPESLTCEAAALDGAWERVATWDGAGTLLENQSGGKAQLVLSRVEDVSCLRLNHEIDFNRFGIRLAARLKNGESKIATVARIEYGGDKRTLICALMRGVPDNEVIAFELYRAPLRWAVIPGITTKPNVPPMKAPALSDDWRSESAKRPASLPKSGTDEASKEILLIKLRHAEEAVAKAAEQFKVGRIPESELQAARDDVTFLRAEISGDPVRLALARLAAAERQLAFAKVRFDAGIIPESEYRSAQNAVELRKAEAQVASAAAGASARQPAGTNTYVAAALAGLDLAATKIRTAAAKGEMLELADVFNHINELCDQLQGKNRDPAVTPADLGMTELSEFNKVTNSLAGLENAAERMRDIARNDRGSKAQRGALLREISHDFLNRYDAFKALLEAFTTPLRSGGVPVRR